MRQVRLWHIVLPDKSSVYIKQKQYSVFLGNGAKCYFTNLKDAKQFIAETNRFLTSILHELNRLYGELFVEYRKVWFYMSDNYETKRVEKDLKLLFIELDNYFARIGDKNTTLNGNYFVFNNLNGIIDVLEKLIKFISEVYRTRRHFSEIKTVQSFIRQLESLRRDLKEYAVVVK